MKTNVYIVRFGCGRTAPESYILGIYPTLKLARARMKELREEGWGRDEMWYDRLEVGPEGADCWLPNR